MKSGLLVVVSGPAGVGKGTVVSRARKKNKNIVYSVSATSRKPRPGEKDGTNYYFVSRERFKEMIRKQELVEWVEYCGNFYGTPRAYVEEQLKKGRIVLLEIEVKGASNIKKQYPECVSIFIAPPDLDELKKRILIPLSFLYCYPDIHIDHTRSYFLTLHLTSRFNSTPAP
jgi:guanylate kinase